MKTPEKLEELAWPQKKSPLARDVANAEADCPDTSTRQIPEIHFPQQRKSTGRLKIRIHVLPHRATSGNFPGAKLCDCASSART